MTTPSRLTRPVTTDRLGEMILIVCGAAAGIALTIAVLTVADIWWTLA